jgi:ketosteroid isomerase-like protein
MKRAVVFISVYIILTACNQSPVVDIRTEAEAINKIEDQWTAAIKVKDIDRILSIFATEAVVMNANTPACFGLQSIRKSLESWFSDATIYHNTSTSAIDTIEVSASGELAYVRGNSQLSISTPKGIVEEKDKWITIYRKINGEWKAIVDIWNSDEPLVDK